MSKKIIKIGKDFAIQVSSNQPSLPDSTKDYIEMKIGMGLNKGIVMIKDKKEYKEIRWERIRRED